MNKNTIIEIRNTDVCYGKKKILHNVSLDIYEKDFLGIIGPNGGGKTTLIKTILGLKEIDKGNISFFKNGNPVSRINIGYLPQYNLIDKSFPISVFDVILSGLENYQTMWKPVSQEYKERTMEIIRQMGLCGLEKKTIGTLSGGQMQRALLGRSIISEPDAVILDEPNTYIDKNFEAQLYELLEQINKKSAIILISHDIGTIIQNVRNIACVNGTLNYHAQNEPYETWIHKQIDCPFDLIKHGTMPHRVLKEHIHQ